MRILVLCAATFLAGILAGAIFWPDRTRTGSRSTPATTVFETARPELVRGAGPYARKNPASPAFATGDDGPDSETPVRELAGRAAEEIDRVLSSEGAEALLEGDGTISGTVRDEAGAPVSGVVVTAQPEAQPFGLRAAGRRLREQPHLDRDLAEVAGDAIQGELWRRQARRMATTGPDGRYELKGLMEISHRLTAYHERYEIKPQAGRDRIEPDAVLDFVARPVVEVRVEVRRPDSSTVDNAWLSWQGPHGGGWGPWTPDDPIARLPVGTCRVKAQTWLPEPMQSEEVEREVAAQPSDEVLVLQLVGRRVLTARLALPEGFATPGRVEYRLRALDAATRIDPVTLLKDPSARKARSASPVRASWFDLEPGRYLVAAFLEGRRLLAHGEAEMVDGPVELDLEMVEPAAGAYLEVRLAGPEGGPVPGVSGFWVLTGSEAAPRYHNTESLQHADGTWLVLLDGIDAKEQRDAILYASTREYGTAEARFDLRNPGTVTLRFRPPSRLRLKVEGVRGSGFENRLYAHLQRNKRPASTRPVGADGVCDLGWVQPDRYELFLVLRDGRGDRWPVLRLPLTLLKGEHERTVRMPALHELRVRLPQRWSRRQLRVSSADPDVWWLRRRASTNGEGVAVFKELAAGNYRVHVGSKAIDAQVPGPEVVVQ